jgi:hypothetical protein
LNQKQSNTPITSYSSQNSLYKVDQQKQQQENESLNIDFESIPDDDTFKPLSTKWWSIDQDGDSMANLSDDVLNDNIIIDIQMTSCNL